jgi:hypothetical protein
MVSMTSSAVSIHEPASSGGRSLGKLFAAQFFDKHKMALGPTIILDLRSNRRLGDSDLHALGIGPYTVRVADGEALGLPRFFLENVAELNQCIDQLAAENRTIIIQPFIEVELSIELNIERDSWVLELVPGIWESSDSEPSDFYVARNGIGKIYRWTQPRKVRLAGPGGDSVVERPPLSRDQLKEMVVSAAPHVALLRRELRGSLPVNVHAIVDRSGRFRFLNIRQGFTSTESPLSAAHQAPHYVTDMPSLRLWDGQAPILFEATAKRGNERSLMELINLLPKGSPPVYVRSMLSHPALLLRQAGVDVRHFSGLNLGGERLPQFDQTPFSIDIDNDPIFRILKEKSLVASSEFHVVHDKEALSGSHYLVLAKADRSAFSDISNAKQYVDLISELSEGFDDGWLYWERGRAPYCTGELTVSRAHSHLLACDTRKYGIERIFSDLGGKRFATLDRALEYASSTVGEYLIIGDNISGFKLCDSKSGLPLDKRFVKSTILRAIRR